MHHPIRSHPALKPRSKKFSGPKILSVADSGAAPASVVGRPPHRRPELLARTLLQNAAELAHTDEALGKLLQTGISLLRTISSSPALCDPLWRDVPVAGPPVLFRRTGSADRRSQA